MDLIKLDKDLKNAQKTWGTLIGDYHTIMLNPKLDEKNQAVAIKYYAEQINALLELMVDFAKYYSSRPDVKAAIMENGLRVSDTLDKLLHQQDFDQLLEDLNDDGGTSR